MKKIYLDKGIITCELNYPGCCWNQLLSFAHKHKRIYYKNREDLLVSFEETILACIPCHEQIEFDRTLTEKEFERLRDEDRLEALEY